MGVPRSLNEAKNVHNDSPYSFFSKRFIYSVISLLGYKLLRLEALVKPLIKMYKPRASKR